MKKIFSGLAFILLFLLIICPASAEGNIEGYIYSTDILTFVNGKPIDGYNIGGRTVIIAEDLDGYGFNVEYNDATRTLKITSYFNNGYKEFNEIARGKVGKITGTIYKTDIKTYYNGIFVKGYNIGGRTAVCIEDLGDLSDSPNAEYGYSKYLGKSIWNEQERTISFESFIQNENEILGISRVYHRFKDNVIYTYPDDFYAISEFSGLEDGEFTGQYTYSPGTGMSKYNLKPLYFDNHGELVKIGLCVANPNNPNAALMFIENVQNVRNMIKTFKNTQMTHDEALKHFTDECDIIEKTENNSYTVLMAKHKTEGLIFVYINKNGGYVVDTFLSGYVDDIYKIKTWFDNSGNNSGPNTIIHTVSPFAGPHGATTMQYASDLDEYDYE